MEKDSCSWERPLPQVADRAVPGFVARFARGETVFIRMLYSTSLIPSLLRRSAVAGESTATGWAESIEPGRRPTGERY
jgi:hypothetical protein